MSIDTVVPIQPKHSDGSVMNSAAPYADEVDDELPIEHEIVEAMLLGIQCRLDCGRELSFDLRLENSAGWFDINVQENVLAKSLPQLPCPVQVHRCGYDMEAQDLRHGKIIGVRPYDAVRTGNAAFLLSPNGTSAVAHEALTRLQKWLGALETPALKQLVNQVLLDRMVQQKFPCTQASRAHHHAYSGGLLVHTLEVIQSARQLTHCAQLDTPERELCEVAALLHDLGKISTVHGADPALDHKIETLKLVERPLQWLIARHPALGRGLETILLQLAYPKGFPAFLGTQIVTLADRFSTACDRNKRLGDLQMMPVSKCDSAAD